MNIFHIIFSEKNIKNSIYFNLLRKLLLFFILIIISYQLPAHSLSKQQRKIEFPDIPGYVTIVSDLHQHTVFSDGSVWPNIRVEEAVKDGVDLISLTEHLEYQPHKEDIPHPDRNRSYHIAVEAAKKSDLLVIRGSEITRRYPPGHMNAVFIQDSNKLLQDDAWLALREAKKQGAFIFWNHPNWLRDSIDGIPKLSKMHKKMIKEGVLHGIEVVNGSSYSHEALQIALDHKLTIMGTTDIHGLIDWSYDIANNEHRPVTLIFAKEKSQKSIKDALFNLQTVVWFKNTLIGRKKILVQLLNASLSIIDVKRHKSRGKDSQTASIFIRNISETDFILRNKNKSFYFHADLIKVKAHDVTEVRVNAIKPSVDNKLDFEVLNAVIAPKKHPKIKLIFRPK